MMKLGTKAPTFSLPDVVSGKTISLSDVKSNIATVVVFICNHCPFVKHINSKLVEVANKYQAQGVQFITISSNDVETHPHDGSLFQHHGPQVVIIGYGIAFYFLSLVLKSIPVGVAYAVWSGLGVVIITAIAWLLHGQKLDAWGFVGMGLIIAAFLLARSPSWKSLRRPTPW